MKAPDSVSELVEIEAIKRLKFEYQRCLDLNDWDGVESCLHAQVESSYGSGEHAHHGRQNLLSFLQSTTLAKPTTSSSHFVGHPVITLETSDRASGTWSLSDTVIDREKGMLLQGAAYYRERYIKTSDGWKIISIGYDRLYEHRTSLAGDDSAGAET